MATNENTERNGYERRPQSICVMQAKGGTGATSICAALGEISAFEKETLLWDLDVETADLTRSLCLQRTFSIDSWIDSQGHISREAFSKSLLVLANQLSVLTAPSSWQLSMKLIYEAEGADIARKLLEQVKSSHDVIIIDTAGHTGATTFELARHSDHILVVIDDTVLGLTAPDAFLQMLKLVLGSYERVSFVVNGYSGVLLAVPQIKTELEPIFSLGERPWRLPPVPVDPKASLWPGSARTLFSMGQSSTADALSEIAKKLGLLKNHSE